MIRKRIEAFRSLPFIFLVARLAPGREELDIYRKEHEREKTTQKYKKEHATEESPGRLLLKLIEDYEEKGLIKPVPRAIKNMIMQSADPPKDIGELLGKMPYYIIALIINTVAFPVAMSAFMIEEAIQTVGMSAYMSYTSKNYELMEASLEFQKILIEFGNLYLETMGWLTPIGVPAFAMFFKGAEASNNLMMKIAEGRQKGVKVLAQYRDYERPCSINITSTPTNCMIAIKKVGPLLTYPDGPVRDIPEREAIIVATGRRTPETFSLLSEGCYVVGALYIDPVSWVGIESMQYVNIRYSVENVVNFDFRDKIAEYRKMYVPVLVPSGKVKVKTKPPGMKVWLDGVDTGKLTPETFTLPLKEHRFEFRYTHPTTKVSFTRYKTVTLTVPGEEAEVDMDLTREIAETAAGRAPL